MMRKAKKSDKKDARDSISIGAATSYHQHASPEQQQEKGRQTYRDILTGDSESLVMQQLNSVSEQLEAEPQTEERRCQQVPWVKLNKPIPIKYSSKTVLSKSGGAERRM